MKLWIDGQALQTASRQRGIGRYVRELIKAICEGNYGFEVSISFNAGMADQAIAARDHVSHWIDPENIHVWQGLAEAGEAHVGYTERRKVSEIAISHHVACLRPDIAISTSPFEGADDVAVPLSPEWPSNTRVASIFYDAIPHRYSNEYLADPIRKSCYYRRLNFYKSFDLNLCISEYSRSEVIELSGNKNSTNISAGVSSDFADLLRDNRPSHQPDLYPKAVLNVGSLDWRKNAGNLVEAFSRLPDFLKQEIKLVLVGDYMPEQLDRVREDWYKHKLPAGNLVALGHISDRELVSLYHSVSLVIQPSLLEGFGLTALEAMSCGTPVIGAATGALPEILGDPDLMFDPTDPRQIADRITQFFLTPQLIAERVTKGLERSQQFSWKKSAELATNAILKLAGQPGLLAASDLASARRQTLQWLGNIVVNKDLIAGALARAEPEPISPRRLLVDATSTVRKDYGTGIQRVTKEIVRNMVLQNRDRGFSVIYCDSSEGFFGVETDAQSLSLRQTKESIRLLGSDIVLMLDSSWEFHREHYPSLLSARQRGAEIVSCLYDLVPIRLEAMCHPGIPPVFVAWLESALSYSTAFVCISKSVADEFIAMLEAIRFPRPLKIGYWHLGADFIADTTAELPTRSRKRNTFLMVGTIEPRKGHRVALEAFESLWKDEIDVDLVVVGKPGWESDQLINRLRLHPTAGTRLRWYPDAGDKELRRLYGECDALLAASFVEGFGLPLVEAMHFGKPIIASDIPVFREVTKNGIFAHFFEVGSPAALAAAIRKFIAQDSRSLEGTTEKLPWKSWSESASELQSLLDDNKWYRVYQPPSPRPFASVFDHGTTRMTGPLDTADRRHRLELTDGPIISGSIHKYVLRVTNLSDQVWSSKSRTDHGYGIFLSYRILDQNGGAMISDTVRFPIPFVMIPGDCHYMAVEVPSEDLQGATVLAVEMFQENVAWWGNPLRLDLQLGPTN